MMKYVTLTFIGCEVENVEIKDQMFQICLVGYSLWWGITFCVCRACDKGEGFGE